MRTRELLELRNTGHPGNALFAKANSADWDFEKDVDWRVRVEPDDPLVGHGRAAYGKTPTFQALPERVKTRPGVRSAACSPSCGLERAWRRTCAPGWS